MNAKRGQFQRQSGSFLCLSPPYLLVLAAAVLCLIGYYAWGSSSRHDKCRMDDLMRYRALLQEANQQKMMLEGRVSELRTMMAKRVKLLSRGPDVSQLTKANEKEKRILALETELVQVKDKLDRCGNMAFRAQSRIEEVEANSKTSTAIRNKTQCDIEIARQYDEIDKWIKTMVDDRTYSQFQMKFGKEGEKSEADKLQRLDKVVMQRDEIKATKDERVKEEIRAREAKLEAQQRQRKGKKGGDKKEDGLPPKMEARESREIRYRPDKAINEGSEKHVEESKGIPDTRFENPKNAVNHVGKKVEEEKVKTLKSLENTLEKKSSDQKPLLNKRKRVKARTSRDVERVSNV